MSYKELSLFGLRMGLMQPSLSYTSYVAKNDFKFLDFVFAKCWGHRHLPPYSLELLLCRLPGN